LNSSSGLATAFFFRPADVADGIFVAVGVGVCGLKADLFLVLTFSQILMCLSRAARRKVRPHVGHGYSACVSKSDDGSRIFSAKPFRDEETLRGVSSNALLLS